MKRVLSSIHSLDSWIEKSLQNLLGKTGKDYKEIKKVLKLNREKIRIIWVISNLNSLFVIIF